MEREVPMRIIAFGIFFHATRDTIFEPAFRASCARGLFAEKWVNHLLNLSLICRVSLSASYSSLIATTYQITVAVQYSAQGTSNSTSTYSALILSGFRCLLSNVVFFGVASSCLRLFTYLSGYHVEYAQLRQWFTLPVWQFCCARSLSTGIAPEATSLACELACFIHFAIGMLSKPSKTQGHATSLHSEILFLQVCMDIRLCTYEDNFALIETVRRQETISAQLGHGPYCAVALKIVTHLVWELISTAIICKGAFRS